MRGQDASIAERWHQANPDRLLCTGSLFQYRNSLKMAASKFLMASVVGKSKFLLLMASVVGGLQGPKPLPATTPLERYPAQSLCSRCGLCNTERISEVKEACAFLEDGWSRTGAMEERIHGRRRNDDYFGVVENMVYGQKRPRVNNSAWTGIVSGIAARALEEGVVDAVIGVGREGDGPFERMTPKPMICRTPAQVLANCPGVKPVLANSLSMLDELTNDDKRILFLGVGCQVQALRALQLEREVYVLGTCCADNVRDPNALERFLREVSSSPETAVGFEFMADYTVAVKHVGRTAGNYEQVPVFSLPSERLKDVIAPSCYSCFDYVNALADLVVGYMAVPDQGVPMTHHDQFIIVRNSKGQHLLDLLPDLDTSEIVETKSPSRIGFAKQVTEQDLDGIFLPTTTTTKPKIWSLPRIVASFFAKLLTRFGPSGLEFARNSIDYHQLRNTVYLQLTNSSRRSPAERRRLIPDHARRIEDRFYPGFTESLLQKYRNASLQ